MTVCAIVNPGLHGLTLFSLCPNVILHGPEHRTQLSLIGGQLLTACMSG